jgi:four helix bundle protein
MADGINKIIVSGESMTMEQSASKTFRELMVWQKAHRFVLAVYEFTLHFPKSETYGLVLQMRKAAVSIPANIAEGFRRRGKADKVRFLNIAEASLEESRYYLIFSKDLKYGETEQLLDSLEEVSCLLNAYSKAILDSSPDFWLLTSQIPARGDFKGRSPLARILKILRINPFRVDYVSSRYPGLAANCAANPGL